MTSTEKRVAIYARVSTTDRGQDPENQLRALREWCGRAGHTIVAEYVDRVSGAKGADQRPRLAAMLDDAHRRQFDMVLVWALDRLSREGMVAIIGYLQRLAAASVSFHSYTEPALSTDNEMVRDIVLAVMASLAKVERQRISERVCAGLDRARAAGKHLGRPRLDDERRAKVRDLLMEGVSIRRAALAADCGLGTVSRIAAEIRARTD